MEEKLNKIFDELQEEAYNVEYHTYDYKLANQIVRKHFEKLVGQIEPLVIPKIAEVDLAKEDLGDTFIDFKNDSPIYQWITIQTILQKAGFKVIKNNSNFTV